MSAAIVARWLEHQILCVLTFNKQLMGCDTQPALGGIITRNVRENFGGGCGEGNVQGDLLGRNFIEVTFSRGKCLEELSGMRVRVYRITSVYAGQ